MTARTFSSRWALVLAALGMAIGTGNVWRFPRVLSANGGGTFLIPWALFLFTWSIPLLMAEFAMGRATRQGPVGAYTRVFGRGAAWRGGFVAFCTVAIMFYYSVVTGWTMRYLGLALSGAMSEITAADAEEVFLGYTRSAWPALTHLASIGAACWIVGRGVAGGIERVCKVLVPALFVVLVVTAVRGLTLEGSGDGLAFLTTVEWSRLGDVTVWLDALSQSAWSTGAGWGLMLAYAVYATSDMRAGRECVVTGVGNNLASLLAALAIIPGVFALAPLAGQDPRQLVEYSGPATTGLTFVWIPVLFREMAGGGALALLFFLGLTFAALSSLIAMVELAVRTFIDLGWTRSRAVLLVFGAGFLLGLPSAIDLAPLVPGHVGLDVFQNQDWVWGVGLIVSGSILAVSILRHGVGRFLDELIETPEGARGGWTHTLFRVGVTVLVPLQALALLGWWFWQAWTWVSATDAEGAPRSFGDRFAEWMDPTALFSVGTCLVQWGVVIGVLLLLNRSMATHAAQASAAADRPGDG